MNREYYFSIADVKLLFRHEKECDVTESFQPFLIEGNGTYEIEFQEVSELHPIKGKMVHTSRSFCVLEDSGEFRRYFYDGLNDNYLYASGSYDWDNKKILIEYIPYGYQFLNETGNSFFHIAWEAILMNENRMMLHSSCINTEYGGILFSGVSGAGKSTQAELWCRYENATLINGDRTILYPAENGWLGYGSPYAGSSRCYKNEKCDIKAIVFLEKESANAARKMGTAEAFRKIYSCMLINSWDQKFVTKACEFITKLVQEIPVYELSCRPDKDAVVCLKKILLEGTEYETE